MNPGDDEENVADESDADSHTDSLVATPTGVRDICAKKGHNVDPRHSNESVPIGT